MAVDDIINDVVSTATSSDYQPAAGVEVVITFACQEANGNFQFYDGTNALTMGTGANYVNNMASFWIGINNTNYIRLNSGSGTVVLSYSGIQTK